MYLGSVEVLTNSMVTFTGCLAIVKASAKDEVAGLELTETFLRHRRHILEMLCSSTCSGTSKWHQENSAWHTERLRSCAWNQVVLLEFPLINRGVRGPDSPCDQDHGIASSNVKNDCFDIILERNQNILVLFPDLSYSGRGN